ncbi:hypothetical protein [Flavonifractor hominis]|uniref:Uncharacterized protein n=1 Tax=Flavonifractor hominis TaxID=3133178 RepID=A0ABV1ES36_9FIRM
MMEFTRGYMTYYLLSFCKTYNERDKEEERLTALTDEALEAEFTAEYNEQKGACPNPPLYEGNIPDLYIDF